MALYKHDITRISDNEQFCMVNNEATLSQLHPDWGPNPTVVTTDITSNRQWDLVRDERMPKLIEADIEINKLEDQALDASAWRTYRQALRDIPQNQADPNNITWPTKP